MDIAQIKSPPAQQDVGSKVVKDKPDFSQADNASNSVAKNIVQLQAKAQANNEQSHTQKSKEKMEEHLTRQVKKMNEYVQSIQRDLKFSIDDGSGEVVVKVFNASTDELVRQFPSEEALALVERMKAEGENSGSGLILKVEV
ncbi:MAG: flagellar protein FlaG [Chromatiales bacterium]|nr:flagellar protein FlaG [Chromatiales bacterium]